MVLSPSVCLSCCLNYCLLTTLHKNYLFSWKIFPEIYLWTRKNRLNFGSHPLLNPDVRIFWKFLQHCKIGYFLQSGSHLWKDRLIKSLWKFYCSCIFGQEIPTKCGGHLYPDSTSALHFWTEFALVSKLSCMECYFHSSFICNDCAGVQAHVRNVIFIEIIRFSNVANRSVSTIDSVRQV